MVRLQEENLSPKLLMEITFIISFIGSTIEGQSREKMRTVIACAGQGLQRNT